MIGPLMPNGRIRARRPLALLCLVISLGVPVLTGCGVDGVSGSGPTKSETRHVDAFTRVEVGNGIRLTLHVGGEQAVEVSAQGNILPLITATVEDGVLALRGAESFTATTPVTVTATVPALDAISASGGSQAAIDGLVGDQFMIDLSGGAGLVATGNVTDVTLVSTGGARADLSALTAETAHMDLSGGATAALNVSDHISGSASGGAVATVAGGATLGVQTSGGASVSSK